MGRSCETKRKKISEVKGRKLKQNESLWDKTSLQKQNHSGETWDEAKWREVDWDEMEKVGKELSEKNN